MEEEGLCGIKWGRYAVGGAGSGLQPHTNLMTTAGGHSGSPVSSLPAMSQTLIICSSGPSALLSMTIEGEIVRVLGDTESKNQSPGKLISIIIYP